MDSQIIAAHVKIVKHNEEVYLAEFDGPGGQYLEQQIPEQATQRAQELHQEMEQLLRESTSSLDQDSAAPIAKTARETGQCLFDAVNADGNLLAAVGLRALSADEPLRVQLHLRDPQSVTWPWELLYDTQRAQNIGQAGAGFLALQPSIWLSRYHDQPVPVARSESVDTLRVLVVVASPAGCPTIPDSDEQIASWSLPGRSMRRVKLDVLDQATPKALWQQLHRVDGPRYHIIHFFGHGYVNEGDDEVPAESGVYMESADGRTIKVEASQFADILLGRKDGDEASPTDAAKSLRGPVLISLCVCDSARDTSSVVNAMVNAGIPAVIGMRRRFSTAGAIFFNRNLYAMLLDGYPLDRVVAECRQNVHAFNQCIDWSTPILYLRVLNGELFRFNKDSHERAEWLGQLRLYSQLAGEQAAEAVHALLALGTSAVALAVASVLAYPLAAVRARAAAVLRALPRTPEVHDSLMDVIGPAVAYEPDGAVRREMVQILTQPGPSSRAEPYLRALVDGSDPDLGRLAEAGLTVPVLNADLTWLFDTIEARLDQLTTWLDELSNVVHGALHPDETYKSYLEQVQHARDEAVRAQTVIRDAERRAPGMSPNAVWGEIKPEVERVVKDVNRAIEAADQAARAARSLASTFEVAMDEAAVTLAQELALLHELAAIVQGLDGVLISDAAGEATITIVRRAPDDDGLEQIEID